VSDSGSNPRHEHRLKSPGAFQAVGIAESEMIQAAELVGDIRSRLEKMRGIDDPRASAVVGECELVLAEIVESLGSGRCGATEPPFIPLAQGKPEI